MKITQTIHLIFITLAFAFVANNALAERTIRYQYNSFGQTTQIDGARVDVSDVTNFEYHATNGNLLKITNALGHQTNVTSHDDVGRPLTIVDANNVTTTLTYNFRGQLTLRTVDGQTTTFEYEPTGTVSKLILPTGALVSYEYDEAQRLIAISDNLGNRIDYTLDAASNRTKENVSDPLGTLTRTQTRVFNALSRLVERLGGENQSTQFSHDPNGNVTETTDGINNTNTQAFDALNRLSEIKNAENGITKYKFDKRDNLTHVIDPKNLTTSYVYDGLDNLIEQNSPDTGITSFTHDEAGNVIRQTNANNITVHYSYDALNRLTNVDYVDNRLDVTFMYDEVTSTNGIGRLTSMTDESGIQRYHYGPRGNVTQAHSTLEGIDYTINYAYNSADQLMQVAYPSGRTVDSMRNSAGQITDVTTTFDGTTQTLASNITYAPFGPLTNLTYGNGLNLTRNFDLDYRLTQQQTNTVYNLSYLYNDNDNITGLLNSLTPSEDQSLDYDKLNRLTDATGTYGDVDFGYDPVGNRVNRTQDGAADNYSYATDSHHLQNTNTNTYSYDNVGNTTSNGIYNFIYGEHNRLKEVRNTADVLVGTYTYNGLGQRTQKEANGKTIYYHYDLNGQRIAETDDAGYTLNEYIYLNGQPIAVTQAAQTVANRYQFNGTDIYDSTKTGQLDVNLAAKHLHFETPSEAPLDIVSPDINWSENQTDTRHTVTLWKSYTDQSYLYAYIDISPAQPPKAYFYHYTPPPRNSVYNQLIKVADNQYTDTTTKPGSVLNLTIAPATKAVTIEETGYPTVTYTLAAERWNEYSSELYQITSFYYKQDGLNFYGYILIYDGTTYGYFMIREGESIQRYFVMDGEAQDATTQAGLYYIHPDHLGTPQKLTNDSQQVVWEANYTPFLQATINDDPDGDGNAITFDMRAPGQWLDKETGLSYNYFRYYSPETGRYINSDPIGLRGGLNTYAYVGGNPLKWVDSFGLAYSPHGEHGIPIPGHNPSNFTTSWGVGGTIGFGGASYNSASGGTDLDINLLPEIGGGFKICSNDPEPACDIEEKPDHPIYGPSDPVSYTIGLKSLGITFTQPTANGQHQSVCINIGLGIGLPFNVTTTKPDIQNEF